MVGQEHILYLHLCKLHIKKWGSNPVHQSEAFGRQCLGGSNKNINLCSFTKMHRLRKTCLSVTLKNFLFFKMKLHLN